MYVPSGKITTPEAVQRLFAARHAEDAARLPELEAQSQALMNTQGEAFERAQAALGHVRAFVLAEGQNLRNALAEGDLTAFACQDNGDLSEVPVAFWRRREALRNVVNGFERSRPRNTPLNVNVRFVLTETDFLAWAFPTAQLLEDGKALTRTSPARIDYRERDKPLVEQGVSGVRTGAFKNATDAARALASRAEGASEASKAARLAKAIKVALTAIQT